MTSRQMRLQSVLDHLRGILVDSVDDDEMVQAVIENDFDAEKSLDKLLNRSQPTPASHESSAYFDGIAFKPSKPFTLKHWKY